MITNSKYIITTNDDKDEGIEGSLNYNSLYRLSPEFCPVDYNEHFTNCLKYGGVEALRQFYILSFFNCIMLSGLATKKGSFLITAFSCPYC